MRKTINDAFVDHDLVVLPSWRVMQPTINEALEREESEGEPTEPTVTHNFAPFNSFGIPAVSIPCGFSADGLPIGLMIAGAALLGR